jgi:hypothetical protein
VNAHFPEVPNDELRIVISNEFASVEVRKVATRNGERLQIRSLGKQTSVRLDAIALEALTWSDAIEVGMALENPLGPETGKA